MGWRTLLKTMSKENMKAITISTDRLTVLKGLDLSETSKEVPAKEKSTILALHGWKDNAASYIPLSQHLRNIRLIAIDFAGHGHSSHRSEGEDYGIWHYVDDIVRVIEQRGESKLTLLGHSLGAAVSVMVAHCIPKKIERLLLIDGLCPMASRPSHAPGILANYITMRKTQQASLSPVRYFSTLDAVIKARMHSHFGVSRASAELLVRRAMVEESRGWRWRTDPRIALPSPVRFTPEQVLAFPASLTMDTHVFYGERGMIASMVPKYREQLPNLQFHELSGGHHFHMDDQPEALAHKIMGIMAL